jgi:hypothetical protein
VRLNPSAREALEGVVTKGTVAAATRQRAPRRRTAAAQAEGPAWPDAQRAEARDGRGATLHRTRHASVAQGGAGALARQRPPGRHVRPREGAQEARRAAGACRPPPEGHARWPLTLLADPMVPLERVAALGKATGRRTRKKMPARRGGKHNGVPHEGNAGVVCALEEGWEGETRPDDAPRPVVGLDEARPQWVAAVTPPRPGQPGHPARQADADARCGTAPLCRLCAPLAGQRHGTVTDPRPNAEGAVVRREVADGP